MQRTDSFAPRASRVSSPTPETITTMLPMVLQTPRLILRKLTLDDAPFMLRLLNDPSFLENIGDKGVRTLDDTRRWLLAGHMASYERHGFGHYLVELKADHAPIGMCGLIKREALGEIDVGFALMPEYWFKGY